MGNVVLHGKHVSVNYGIIRNGLYIKKIPKQVREYNVKICFIFVGKMQILQNLRDRFIAYWRKEKNNCIYYIRQSIGS